MKLGIIVGIILILTSAVAAADTTFEGTYVINWTFNTGGWAKSLSLSKDGRYLAAGSGDTNIYLLDMDGEKIWSHKTGGLVKNVAITANGSNVAASSDTLIYYMDFKGKPAWRYDIGAKDASYIALSDSGMYTAAVSEYPDNKLFFFNQKGVLLWTYKFRDPVVGLVLSADGNRLAVATMYGNVYLFSRDGKIIWTYNIPTRLLSSLSMSPDASLIAATTKKDVYVLDNTKKLKWTKQIDGEIVYSAFLDNGSSILLKTKNNELYFFDAEGGLDGSVSLPDFIGSVSFSNDIKNIAAGSKSPAVSIYFFSLETPAEAEPPGGIIEVNTNTPSSSFQVTGPDKYTGSGTEWKIENVTAGTYNIQYMHVNGFIAPPNESKIIANGETIQFTGLYTLETYEMQVASEPSGASVHINDEYVGDTPLTIDGRLPGVYDLRFRSTGYRECLIRVDLQRNEYILCELVPLPGMIIVETNIPASFVVEGPQRLVYGGTSTRFENIKHGEYTITYEKVACYTTPKSETRALEKGGSITFQGTFILKTLSIATTADRAGIENPRGAGVYDCGAIVTVKAVDTEGYDFLKWAEGGVDISFEKEYSFKAKTDTHLRAVYVKKKASESPPPKISEPGNPYIKVLKGLIEGLREYLNALL